ncbi:hypothetical protein [Aureimonas sp. ME7]|uniref:hypothetical protein n=1 Tax=Aureimonas sp. ME7 TaxID=2744252 RepID=UPI0015F4120E|nr:hypothetical protein [Aureimonas sp. ME7]
MSEADPAAELEALVARVAEAQPSLSPIAAAVLAAIHLGLAADSRSFANRLGLAHALALREVGALTEAGYLRIERRDAKTMRVFYALEPDGVGLLERAAAT